jgi:hypothetical protein
VDILLEGDDAPDICEDAHVIVYLQKGEVLVGWTPKECEWVVHKAKQFKWESNSPLQMWTYGWMWVVFCP